ncbi:hypothetical protein RA19_03730 [Leisingera sp. ANG-M1]|nr:hypothetical protein RA19_03730 [Leisingera sp. ANG-M1]
MGMAALPGGGGQTPRGLLGQKLLNDPLFIGAGLRVLRRQPHRCLRLVSWPMRGAMAGDLDQLAVWHRPVSIL